MNKASGKYLKWRKENADGIRGITQFSHWFHGRSGIIRAKNLQKTVSRLSVDSKEFENFKKIFLKKYLNVSSTRHSLSRFIYTAIIGDAPEQVQQISDATYKKITMQITR